MNPALEGAPLYARGHAHIADALCGVLACVDYSPGVTR